MMNTIQVNATEPHQWEFNIGSSEGLVSSGHKPLREKMLTQTYIAMV